MQNFDYENQTKIVFGRNDETVIAKELKKLGVRKLLLHYGQNSIVKSGLLGRIKDALDKIGIDYVEYGGVKPNPLRSHALEGVEIVRKTKVDFVLAVGGGSVIDSAKCIAIGALNDDVWSYYINRKQEISEALPIGAILTIPAAGSENSTSSVIVDDRDNLKYVYGSNVIRPKIAFINPEYCFTLPKHQIANGASDILAHLLERYFCPDENIGLTDKILTSAIQTMLEIAPKVYNDQTNYDYMAEFCLLGTIAHNGMLSLGRVNQDWGTHNIEMETLSGPHDTAHGAGLAVIFPAWMKYVKKTRPSKILQFAREVMNAKGESDDDIINNAILKLKDFYRSIDLAVTLNDLGINLANTQKYARIAFNSKTVLGGYGQLNLEDILNILELAR